MIERLLIIAKWLVISGIYFFVLSYFMPGVVASMLATLLTCAAFFHPDNRKEFLTLKRPEIWVCKGN